MSKPKQESSSSSGINIKIRNLFLVIVVAVCTFVAPFLVWVLTRALQAEWFVSVACGFTVFFVGLALIIFLAWKKIIT